SNLWEMTSERIASSLARPPALRITCASPSDRPAYFAGSSRASMQVRIAKRRAGGNASSPFLPKVATYSALAANTSSRILLAIFSSLWPCAVFRRRLHARHETRDRFPSRRCARLPLANLVDLERLA